MKRKVIPRNKIGTPFPIFDCITIYLLLDHLNAPPLVWGILGTLVSLVLIAGVSQIREEVSVIPKELEDE